MQRHIMFDIDGTLVQSFEFDEVCFTDSVKAVLNSHVDTDWDSYVNVTDTGLLMELLERTGSRMPINELIARVKALFIKKIREHADVYGVKPIAGATEFVAQLQQMRNVTVSFATGGWLESALIKLESAGFDTHGCRIASSNDHFQRTEIMRQALNGDVSELILTPTYFGDAAWDKKACAELGFDFVLVGDRTDHAIQIDDYRNTQLLESILGINLDVDS